MSITFKTSQKQRHPSQKPEQWVLWTNPLWQAEYSSPHLEWNRKKVLSSETITAHMIHKGNEDPYKNSPV